VSIEVPNECQEIIMRELRALMASLTDDPTRGRWIPEGIQEGINFEQFTNQIFEPYILREVG